MSSVESSGFFNAEYDESSESWDRVYVAEQFAEYFKQFIGNGVYAGNLNGLQVKQYSEQEATMSVRLTSGTAFINGFWYKLPQDLYFDVPINTTVSQRADCVCLRLDSSSREIVAVYKPNSNTPTRDENIYELMLCTVTVYMNAISITDANITDRRLDDTVCGAVAGVVEQINFDSIYSQFQAWMEESEDDFNEWYDHIKEQMSGDIATNLQNQIDDLDDELTSYKATVNGQFADLKNTYEQKQYFESYTIKSSGWSGMNYSLESTYPSSTWDILDIVIQGSATQAQRNAWMYASCGGYYSTNVITAKGVKPTIDIPVYVLKRKRVS